MIKYPFIQTIRYMGNKGKLLDLIIPEIERITNAGDLVCDIMAGTNAIGYSLKSRNRVITNDIQYYSYVIARCLLGSYKIPTKEKMHEDLDENIKINRECKKYSFFVDNYTDTYFSGHQCLDIDSIRYAIEKVAEENIRFYYLTLLMSAMCKAQSTTGHFAQYMNKDHKRIIPLRQLSIYDLFFSKSDDFADFIEKGYDNINYNLDYKEMFKLEIMNDVKCFYLDSPYTTDQYSRFYHILETICKYDNPKLEHKAKYRNDRIQSDFCYKKSVLNEFTNIISFCKSKKAKLVISYSNHGVIGVDELIALAKEYYEKVTVKKMDYDHSSQGKGTIEIQEILLILE